MSESDSEVVAVSHMSRRRALRFAVALLCSHGIAPYPGARFSIRYALSGRWDIPFGCLALVFMLIGGVCGYRQLVDQPRGRRLLYGVSAIVLWIAVNFVLIGYAIDSPIPLMTLGLLSFAGTLWFPWVVLGLCFVRERVFAGSLIVCGICAVGFCSIIEITGLTGDARVEVAWQKHQTPPSRSVSADNNFIDELGRIQWSGYQGSDRTGRVQDVAINGNWGQNPPQEIWRVPCGHGWSSFAATSTTLFSQEQIDGMDCVVARDLTSGRLLWTSAETESGFKSGMGGDGPRATPTLHEVTGESGSTELILLTAGPQGACQCLNAADGSVRWHVELSQLFPGENLPHGVCASPLVVGENVLVCPPAPDGPCVVALRIADGELIWKCQSDWRSSYASPQLMTIAGAPQVVLHGGQGVLSLNPDSGAVNWRFPWSNEWDNNATQPLAVDGYANDVIIATGYRGGAVRLRVSAGDDGTLQVSEVWKTTSTLRTKFCNMAQFDGVLVSLDSGILVGVEIETGERLWKRGRYGHGQLLTIGDHLIVQAEKGHVFLLQPDRSGPNELTKVSVLDRKTWNHPIIAGDLLLVRNDVEIVCLRLSVPPRK